MPARRNQNAPTCKEPRHAEDGSRADGVSHGLRRGLAVGRAGGPGRRRGRQAGGQGTGQGRAGPSPRAGARPLVVERGPGGGHGHGRSEMDAAALQVRGRRTRSATSTSRPATTPATASPRMPPGSTTRGTLPPRARPRHARGFIPTSSSAASSTAARCVAGESGEAGNPIRLTSDPAWGDGEAMHLRLGARDRLEAGRRQQGHPGGREGLVRGPGLRPAVACGRSGTARPERVELARTPNWKVSDPNDVMSEWWTWEQPELVDDQEPDQLPGPPRPHRHRQEAPDRGRGLLQGRHRADRVRHRHGHAVPLAGGGLRRGQEGRDLPGHLVRRQREDHHRSNRYYLEDKPQYLDEPGEFWFDKKGAGGRLYLRLTGDRDPNQSVVEVARHLDSSRTRPRPRCPRGWTCSRPRTWRRSPRPGQPRARSRASASAYLNTYWDLTLPAWMHKEVDNACIRLLGTTDDVRDRQLPLRARDQGHPHPGPDRALPHRPRGGQRQRDPVHGPYGHLDHR